MKRAALLAQSSGHFFTLREIAQIFGLDPPSARVFVSRKVRSGELLRARRDLYLLPEWFQEADEKDLFLLSNRIQTPSYVSFVSALSWLGLTTAIPPSVIESANPVRSCRYRIEAVEFRYTFCRPVFYFGFERRDGFFIATPEKALLDCLYLSSLGRYSLDRTALDLKDLDVSRIRKFLKKYPRRFGNFYKEWRKKYEDTRAS